MLGFQSLVWPRQDVLQQTLAVIAPVPLRKACAKAKSALGGSGAGAWVPCGSFWNKSGHGQQRAHVFLPQSPLQLYSVPCMLGPQLPDTQPLAVRLRPKRVDDRPNAWARPNRPMDDNR